MVIDATFSNLSVVSYIQWKSCEPICLIINVEVRKKKATDSAESYFTYPIWWSYFWAINDDFAIPSILSCLLQLGNKIIGVTHHLILFSTSCRWKLHYIYSVCHSTGPRASILINTAASVLSIIWKIVLRSMRGDIYKYTHRFVHIKSFD